MSQAAKRSFALSFYTLISRILGLFRDHFMAVSFGTGMVASAFSVAYRLPNMFRNLLAEGTLSQSFMPLYSDAGKEGEEAARRMSGAVLSFLFVILLCFVVLIFTVSPFALPLLVGGSPEYSGLVVELTYILFFLIVTASLSSIYMAISNVKNRFFVPSLSPIILNLSYLTIFLGVFPFVEWELLTKVQVLCFAIVSGGIIQLLVQAWYVSKNGEAPIFSLNYKHPAIRKIFKLMLPAAIGGGFYQLGLLVDIFLANWVQNHNPGLGAVVSLDYSQRLVQLPTGIIGVALATTTLPALLSALKQDRHSEVPGEMLGVLGFASFLTAPAALGMGILAGPILDSIYFGGRWDHVATNTAILPLIFYSVAVPFYSMNKVLISTFYAFQDTKTPLRVQAFTFIVNLALNFSLVFALKHSAIALASATSTIMTWMLLSRALRKHDVHFPWNGFFRKISILLLPLLLMGIFLFVYKTLVHGSLVSILLSKGFSYANSSRISLLMAVVPAMGIFFSSSLFLGLEEIRLITGKIFRKR
ncbi:murein biosynthesis integral membrane protein MurJ [Leptospira langatensis]|uniref:Probable lipid II flippase MurJ n=1 Tax=Leptospira langatensis TaxID=2484983 RepID=A0A5F1ZNG5_9LEPT|nr:murein biosynthesis integral membrane protein MurJ [Leptospira langatensis]TGK05388.1 murein biosynthesis integral membrane protein MurJ [Leptospira langatensis]TGL38524.1 murein biosynthesis integral membrane protein MurJ [Leptospira langatensis]